MKKKLLIFCQFNHLRLIKRNVPSKLIASKLMFEETVVPQNIDFKLIESENIDDDFIELPILSNV
jgi:hypothetical protein